MLSEHCTGDRSVLETVRPCPTACLSRVAETLNEFSSIPKHIQPFSNMHTFDELHILSAVDASLFPREWHRYTTHTWTFLRNIPYSCVVMGMVLGVEIFSAIVPWEKLLCMYSFQGHQDRLNYKLRCRGSTGFSGFLYVTVCAANSPRHHHYLPGKPRKFRWQTFYRLANKWDTGSNIVYTLYIWLFSKSQYPR
jgi:hypothetical protein